MILTQRRTTDIKSGLISRETDMIKTDIKLLGMIIEMTQRQNWIVESGRDFISISAKIILKQKTEFTSSDAINLCSSIRVTGRYAPYLITEMLKILLECGSICEQNEKYAVCK